MPYKPEVDKIDLDIEDATSDDFWDCACDDFFIHKKTEELHCNLCNAEECDNPDSMWREIIVAKNVKGEDATGNIVVQVSGGVASCNDPRVTIIDHDHYKAPKDDLL